MTTPQPGTHSHWLREQRHTRGWNIQQMARKLAETARAAGDTTPATECLATMIRRWEKGSGISERYRLHYCSVFQIQPRHFGGTPAPEPEPAADTCNHEPLKVALIVVIMPACGHPATAADDSI
jgi:hypothetical protein